jgi:cytochrome c biogenesis protein CcmG/thiol:disulfide interchange protein DsbE
MTGFIKNGTLKTDDPSGSVSRRRLLLALPVVGFVGLAAVFAWGISRDPNQLPSALIGKELPRFDLPPVVSRSIPVRIGNGGCGAGFLRDLPPICDAPLTR